MPVDFADVTRFSPFEHHVDARLNGKPVAFDRLDRTAVSIEQGRGRHDELQFQVRVLVNRFERGADAGVAGARRNNDADLSFTSGQW
jgi:hypothetical protein